jgi:hypothetical protein
MSNTPIPVQDKQIMDKDLGNEVNLVSHVRKTPLVLYGIFVELARQFYSDINDLPIAVEQTWNEDPKLTKIWIDTEYKWEDENPELRPAIYIKLSDIQYKTYTEKSTSLIAVDLQEGEYHHQRVGMGSVQFVHIGRTKGEGVILAGTTMDYMDSLSLTIRDDFCFDTFEAGAIAPITLDKESKERYRSVVTMKFSFQDNWAIKMESPKLKRIVINAGEGLWGRLQ